ncbi:hypothetical protein LOZ58_004425 [Ophidiomyces ophidiicola]|nr:hypothetical protein LOZ66_003493 [Ophidiomyces ophidiicola]KAI1959616.1 hypothetical protein LOZ58_004425 [Ophidiomyces ophidiicola]
MFDSDPSIRMRRFLDSAQYFDNFKPELTKVSKDDDLYHDVAWRFLDGWNALKLPSVLSIYQLTGNLLAINRYNKYRLSLEREGEFRFQGLSLANEKLLFRGVPRYCPLGEPGVTTPCAHPDCKLCEAICEGFGPDLELKQTTGFHGARLGLGLYTTAESSKADKYAKNKDTSIYDKAILLCKVAIGEPFRTTEDMPMLTSPPLGFDSVHAVPGRSSSFSSDERVVYTEEAIVPAFLIIYNKSG